MDPRYKKIQWLVLGFSMLIMFVFLIGFLLPQKFEVSREIEVETSANKIFPLINEIRKWPDWTVWNVMHDPTLRLTFEGPEEGVGAKELWYSEKMGDGSIELTYSSLNSAVNYTMITQEGRFEIYGSLTLSPTTTGTSVVWKSRGNLPFNPVSRYFGLFMRYLLGPDMDYGLAKLKQKAEANS